MTLTDAAVAALIEAVRDAARTEIMPRFRNLGAGDVDTKSGPDDLVTLADRAAEAAIGAAARAILPGAAIVGEEGVAADPASLDALGTARLCVVIDPIDGTGNYVAGLALFGVILAVIEEGETVFGLLYDPVMDDWVKATRGGGTWFCRPGKPDRRLGARTALEPADAHGYVPLFLYPPDERAALVARFPRFARVSSLRCSCHEYRTIAFGHAQFNLAPAPKPWDHAAGALIVEECGGLARLDGHRPYTASASGGTVLVVDDRRAFEAFHAALFATDPGTS